MSETLTCDVCGSASNLIEDSEDFPAFENSRIIVLCNLCEDKYIDLIRAEPNEFLKFLEQIN